MYEDYTSEEIEDFGDQQFWQQVENDEQREWEEDLDVEKLLSEDPGYKMWADALDRENAFERDLEALAEIEAERNFNTLSAWD
jgi:hypothetical protein